MNDDQNTLAMEEQIRDALGSAPEADFESWRQEHAEALEFLNPSVPFERSAHRWKIAVRIATAMVAALALLFTLTWVFVPRNATFAQTIKSIDTAKAVTWETTYYTRCVSADGKRTWLRSRHTEPPASTRWTRCAPNNSPRRARGPA